MSETIEKPAKKTSVRKGGSKASSKTGVKGKAASSRRGAGKSASPAPSPASSMNVSPEMRRQMIAEAAYFRAEARGFAPGHELEDWVAAEEEVDLILAGGSRH